MVVNKSYVIHALTPCEQRAGSLAAGTATAATAAPEAAGDDGECDQQEEDGERPEDGCWVLKDSK